MTSQPERSGSDPSRAGIVAPVLSWASRHPALSILVIAVLARAITFGNPVVHVDEQFYFATARAMWNGAVPFVDVWDRKPIGLFLVYMLPARVGLPWGIVAYQLLALLSLVATAGLVTRMAQRAGWQAGALFGGVAYVLWPNLLEGQGGQSPIFYNLLLAGAASLIMGGGAARFRTAAPALLVVGLAMQIKYSVVFEGVFFGLWCMAARWRRDRSLAGVVAFGAVLAALALVPTVVVGACYWAAGRFDAFWFANFTAITLRRANPFINQYTDLLGMVAIVSPLLSMAVLALAETRRRGFTDGQAFAFGWLGASVFGVAVFGTWFIHYALPIIVPGAVCAAGVIERSAAARRWALICLLAVAIGGQVLLVAKRVGRGSASEFYALARSVNAMPGCLFVYSGPPMLYAASDRCRPTRFTFPTQLSRDREMGAIGADQASELRRIRATRPATVVMRPPYEGERPEIHAEMEDALRRDYVLRAEQRLGSETIRVFSLRQGRRRASSTGMEPGAPR
jgi:hypothetical protein